MGIKSVCFDLDGTLYDFQKVMRHSLRFTLAEITRKIKISKCKVFTRGFNLLTISKIKKLDPESINAGITDYPLMTSVTAGLTISF